MLSCDACSACVYKCILRPIIIYLCFDLHNIVSISVLGWYKAPCYAPPHTFFSSSFFVLSIEQCSYKLATGSSL